MANFVECPYCKFKNQPDIQLCKKCGQPLTMQKSGDSNQDRGLVNWVARKVNRVLDVTDEFLDAFSPRSSSQKPAPKPRVRKSETPVRRENAVSNQAQTVRSHQKLNPRQPGTMISYFQILEAMPLAHSNYYKVYDIRCEHCKHENRNRNDLKCTQCRQPLRKFVIRESAAVEILHERIRKNIIHLSEVVTGVLKHNQIFYLDRTQYILLDGFPEPWFSLGSAGVLPIKDKEKATAWLTQVGFALKGLHQSGFMLNDETNLSDWVEPILVLKNQQAYLADISAAVPVETNGAQVVQKGIIYLAKVLYTIVSGARKNITRSAGRYENVPDFYKEVIMKALSGSYSTIDGFLNALRPYPREPEIVRSLRQLVGYGTDVGKNREHNEDYVSKFSLGLEQVPGTPEVGLYVVADGMGGHQAGEKASESVIKDVVINRIQEQMQQLQAVPKLKRATIKLDDVLTPGEILREAIIQANHVLLKARKASSGRDRGTTITAALVVGSTCTIANVGDSRTYLMRKNQLEQVTKDHSLVASLLASNMIQPNEVRSHPQRNQIYRTLGDKSEVEVDIFQKTLFPGDQLLLCSDGLWEMVLDENIAKIMSSSRTPQSACDALIEAANNGGGEDNISVIVVWLE